MAYHILIVDDEDEVLAILRDLFEKEGYRVSTAQEGTQALDILQQEVPDLILADYQMPGIDGIELFKRTLDLCPYAIRSLITAHGDLLVAQAAINEASVYNIVTKP